MTEYDLYAPTLAFLERTGRLREDTLVAQEFPLHGRSVDLVTLTRSGSLSSYEFKLRDVGGVLRQATYNLKSFDRSFIILHREPTPDGLELATGLGIGVFVVRDGKVLMRRHAGSPRFVKEARQRAIARVQRRARPWSDHVRL